MRKIIIASNNAHKVEEIKTALDFEGWTFQTLKQAGLESDPAEDADSFEGNARIKALAAHRNTGLAAIADDSGLMVEALGGAPGVYSSRYAGEGATDADNKAKLLRELADVPAPRTARFRTVIAYIDPDGREHLFHGKVEGEILTAPAGDGGFGYDPVFRPKGWTRSFAQASPDEKNAVSHRGNVVRAFTAFLLSDKPVHPSE